MKTVSIIIPVYNEQDVLPELRRKLCEVIDRLVGYAFEIILVDDASSDDTPRLISGIIEQDPRFKTIRFPRNFGSHIALRAGIDHCTGDYAYIMAADLQDPPELIPPLLEKMEDGYNVVWGYREKRNEPLFEELTSNFYNFMMRKFAFPSKFKKGADVVVFDRNIIHHLRFDLREKNSNLFTLIRWIGYRQTGFGYEKQARFAGYTKLDFAKRLKIGIDSFVSFSFFPIRLITYMGISVAFAGGLYALFLILYRFLFGFSIPGYSSLMVAILVLSGIQMIMLGVVAEYLWRTYDAARDRPLYLIEKSRGFETNHRESEISHS